MKSNVHGSENRSKWHLPNLDSDNAKTLDGKMHRRIKIDLHVMWFQVVRFSDIVGLAKEVDVDIKFKLPI